MKDRKTSLIRTISIVVFALFILIPIGNLIIWVFTERWAWPDLLPQVISLRAIKEIIGNRSFIVETLCSSLFISSMVAIISAIIGVMTSRALVLYEFKGKGLLQILSILPFLVPATVFAMGIQVTFIRWGLNNTVGGIILAHTICSLPYAVKLIMDSTMAVGIGLEEQARVLGAGPFRAFFTVTLPLLRPGILSGMSMAFVVSLSQYFLTLLLGGGQVKTFAIVMVPFLQGGDRNISSIYSLIFLAISLTVFAIMEGLLKRLDKNDAVEYY